jgi:outer membrane protein assembly factor BamB
MTLRLLAALIPAVVMATAGAGVAAAQPQSSNPVYVDDSPSARETFLGIRDQLAAGNLDGAVRVLQRLLDEEPERLVDSPEDSDLFIGVREAVHRVLLATPELLERYRQSEGAKAQRALDAGQAQRVEAAWLLTPAGLEAALWLAQEHLEAARFDAAWFTLRQLDAHPDRRGAGARDCAAMLAALAPYLDRAEVWEMASRWSQQATGAPVARRAEPWPLAAARRGQTPLDEGGSMDLEGLVAKALWTVPVSMAPAAPVRQVDPPGVEPLPLFARQLRMLPTVAGESVYVNDGTTVGAWDRFTLARRWMVGEDAAEPEKPDASVRFAQRRPRQGSFDEPSTVTVAGPDLLAITGTPDSENRRDGNQRLVLVEADSGRVRWSVDPTAGDEQLQGAVLRAAPVLADGVAVAAARKINTNRRLTGLYLIGVDRATGQTLWRRLVGSVGALPFGRGSTMLDAILLHNGVVYIGDQLGVIGAYEAHSGRPVWVRRIDTRNTWLSGESARPWELHVPLADGDTILTLSPDRTELLRIGAADGMIRERRSTEAMGVPAPRYLIRAGDLLGIVSESRVSLLPIANLGRAPARSHRFADPGIRGRVVGSDGKIVVPLATGVAELDTLDPEAAPREVPLESPGNVLAMASQLLVVDDGRMHSYLLWDAAERVLNERMRAEPDNPMPAVTFAELAYRASRPEHILGAVQAAAAAVDRDPASEVNAQARRRLFASVLAMVNVSQEPPGKGQAPGEIRLVDPRLIGALIDELGSLADDAGERASYLLALGRFQESQGRHAQAVETYQRVLDEPPLAAATWTGPQISLRAELEATWRLQRLLAEQGPAVYAAHEAAAEAELAALGPAADAAALERLARRYPVAAMAPRLWLRLADRQRDQGRGQAEVSALEAGLRAASWRIDSDPALVAELGGRLVRALEAQGQQAAAAQVLRELARRRPGLEFQEGTGTIAAATLLEGIEARLAAKYRWPRVGPVRDDGVQLIPGHSMLRARVPDITPSVGRALALTDGDSVSVWGPERVGDGEQAEPGPFVKRWSAPIPGRGVDLVRVENDAVYLHYDTRAGAVLEKVSATEGRSLWRTPAFPDLFPPEGPPGVRREPEPLKVRTRDGVGLVTDLLVSMDERTLTLVERSGRAVGIDAHSGDVLWAQRAPLTQVADTDLRGGTLIVAGDQEIAGAPVAAPGAGIVTVVLSIDVRTGQVLQRFESRWGQARWLRALDGGAVIVGFDEAIVSVDIERGQTNWVVDDRRVTESREAWVVGDRAFVQDAGGSLWVLAVPNGRLHPQQVRLPPEFRDGYSRLYAAALAHPGRAGTPSGEAGAADRAVIAFSTLAGVVLVSADGEVVAADAIPGNDTVVPPVPAEGLMVTVESDPAGYTQDGMMVFNMHAMEVATGRLTETKGIVLGARPSRIMLMDGRIAITAGSATVLVRAPAEAP